ncbi:unnamed protein product [Calicophoron daubneyi]|uniref:Integrase catalytic domain-containing protein n=1 Tax=Calicophoron daubneyi TaxID=300641 RepID=A0AAV2TC65_CALDB
MALMRFISRRGKPKVMFSDNGTNFVGAEAELKRALLHVDQERVQIALANKGIEWNFNPPGASHWGGVWERMIRTTRRLLQAVAKQQVMTDETLVTYLAEVERIINDRPIVPVYDDPSAPHVLTPNDLILLGGNRGLVCNEPTLADRYKKAWRQAQYLSQVFWKRWVREYLPTIQIVRKWTKTARDLRPGDLVMLVGATPVVGEWPKGVIIKVHQGEDGHVRDVYVRTSAGTLRRDVRSLCLLEGAGPTDHDSS